jgi:hypothetical protein
MCAITNGGAEAAATIPDTCNTPAPPSAPLPIPYPNTGSSSMMDPGTLATNVLIENMLGATQSSKILMSEGDEAGTAGGLCSGKFMGEVDAETASAIADFGGRPAIRITDMTSHNATNTLGTYAVPSQFLVMIMA